MPLCSHDLADLRASGLTDATIRANGLRTERDPVEVATILNRLPDRRGRQIPEFCQGGGLVLPYRDLTTGAFNGFARVKPRWPRVREGKPVKYEQPAGEASRAYFPKSCLDGLRGGDGPIFITEGEKKALATSQLGLDTIGLGGVWCWKKKGSDELIPDLAGVPWTSRVVYIVFDHDPAERTRRNVATAAVRLARALRKAGTKEVYQVELPRGPDGKQGVDDFLVAQGEGGAEAFRALVDAAEPVPAAILANYGERTVPGPDGKDRTIKVGRTAADIRRRLSALVGDWPRRVGNLLFAAEGCEPVWLDSVDALFAWVGRQLDEPIRWAAGEDKVGSAVFHAHLRQTATAYEAVELLPHCPPLPGHFYMHPPPEGSDGKALEELLGRFHPATEADRSLMHAAILTLFWGGRPGSRPAFLIEAEDDDGQGGRGAGKTTLAEVAAALSGGHFDARPSEDIDKLLTRLLSPEALGRRVCLLDNVKTLRFSWADLEGLITADTISGRRLYVGEGRRPNTLTWFITLNNASLSKDMAQRCVIIRVKRPIFDACWKETTLGLIEEKRWAIIGDILARLSGPAEALARHSRWAAWEEEVLARVPDPAACQKLIADRQAEVDGDQEDSDLVRGAFAAYLRSRGHDPDRAVVFIPSSEAARVVNDATGEERPKQRATAYLQTLAVKELRKSNAPDGSRGWRWTGAKAPPGATATKLGTRPTGPLPTGGGLTAFLKARAREER
jgi:hypothetical protein